MRTIASALGNHRCAAVGATDLAEHIAGHVEEFLTGSTNTRMAKLNAELKLAGLSTADAGVAAPERLMFDAAFRAALDTEGSDV